MGVYFPRLNISPPPYFGQISGFSYLVEYFPPQFLAGPDENWGFLTHFSLKNAPQKWKFSWKWAKKMCPKLFKIVIFCICMHIFGLRCFVFTFYIEFLHILMYKGRFWLIRVRSRRSSGQKSGPFFYLVEYPPPRGK